MKGQLALALSLSPFVIRSRRFHLPPDLKDEACYCGDRRSGEKGELSVEDIEEGFSQWAVAVRRGWEAQQA